MMTDRPATHERVHRDSGRPLGRCRKLALINADLQNAFVEGTPVSALPDV
jgi:hypothetical protein